MIVTPTAPYFEYLSDPLSLAYQAMQPHIASVMSEFRLTRHTHTLVVVQHCMLCAPNIKANQLLKAPDTILVSPLMGYYPADAGIAMMSCRPPLQKDTDRWADAAPDVVHFVVNWRHTIQAALQKVPQAA